MSIQRFSGRFATFYKVCIFLFFINSMHPWFFLNIPQIWITLCFLMVTFIAYFRSFFNFNLRPKTAIIFTCMFVWLKIGANINGLAEAIINAYIFTSILSLKRDFLLTTLSFTTKWLAIILLISSIAFILVIIGIPLPHSTMQADEASGNLSINNYYLFINAASFTEIGRFRSIFLEPGYLTLGVAPLLFIHKYNIKNKAVLVLLFSQLLSFSLAGYILLIFGYIYCAFCQSANKGVKKIVTSVFVLILGFIAMFSLFGQDYIQKTLIGRLEFVNGTFVGNNRSSLFLDGEYEKLMSSDDKWIGTTFDVSQSESGVSGYKLFVVEHGLIGIVLVVLAYISLISLRNIRFNYLTGFIILCLLLLYQNSYPQAICILFTAACAIYTLDKNNQYEM